MHMRRPLRTIACLVLAGLPGAAGAQDDVFFAQLPAGYESAIQRCVDAGNCDAIAALNRGRQFLAVTIWGRRISDALAGDIVAGRVMVDAAELERLIGRYYLWPADTPKRGRIDVHSLPGLTVTQGADLVLALEPERGFTRELTLGGRRIVAPDEFDLPGTAVFGDIRARFDAAFGGATDTADLGARFDGAFGVQTGLWQYKSAGWVGTRDELSVAYAFAERPFLDSATRVRAGLTSALGCRFCFTGQMVGASLFSDSLQGLLYSPADTAYLDVTVPGDVDTIEIVVNGRTTRSEPAFPGFHTVAVSALADGPNLIEVYGIDRESGRRRLLATETQVGSPGMLGEGRAEWKLEAGWALGSSTIALNHDPEWRSPFAQFTRSLGLGAGRQITTSGFLASDAILASATLNTGSGRRRLGVSAIGSLSAAGVGVGGGASFSERFGPFNVSASAQICFDCFDANAFAVVEGFDARAQAHLSTTLGRWTASASLLHASDDPFGWNVTLRRPIERGSFELYARDTTASGIEAGFRFRRTLAADRSASIETGIKQVDGRLVGRAAYRHTPRSGEGYFWGADLESDGLASPADAPGRVGAEAGYQDDLVFASARATHAATGSATNLTFNAATGFVWTDDQFVLTRSSRAGGLFASGLVPGSDVIGDPGTIGRVNRLGHAHLNSLARTEKSRVILDEGLMDGGTARREAELLLVPGLIYGLGDRYRLQERSYRVLIAPDLQPPSPGLAIRDDSDNTVGYVGYDGIATVDGPAGRLHFTDRELMCTADTGAAESGEGGLPQLIATCVPVRDPDGWE